MQGTGADQQLLEHSPIEPNPSSAQALGGFADGEESPKSNSKVQSRELGGAEGGNEVEVGIRAPEGTA